MIQLFFNQNEKAEGLKNKVDKSFFYFVKHVIGHGGYLKISHKSVLNRLLRLTARGFFEKLPACSVCQLFVRVDDSALCASGRGYD